MKKIVTLLGLGMLSNQVLAHDMGGIILALFGFVIVLQTIIAILDYVFTGKSIKGTFLLTALFLLGIPLLKLLAFALQSFTEIRGGMFTILIIFSLFIFPFVTKSIIVRIFKNTFKRKVKTIIQENNDMVIEDPKKQ